MPRRRKPPPVLELIAAGEVEDALLRTLGADVEARLGLQWRMGDPLPLRDEWRDGETGLYRSIFLMHALMAGADGTKRGAAPPWRMAIAEAGFCAADIGPVFGEAEVEGCCAVVGLAPLRAGSGADADVLRGRLLTEALHELGHLAGAEHCRRASCVMYPSLDIADTDHKRARFCADCAEALKRHGIRKS
jgi:predicted Zn-dependent protease